MKNSKVNKISKNNINVLKDASINNRNLMNLFEKKNKIILKLHERLKKNLYFKSINS